ncbi:right-handed parallel beta-helix repeat-containing protein [Bacillus sp. OE]|uniref:right-handed parallel beta-helix repeat-containing protein n=1 Tax=Bacillus sp. OE TaxID=2293320 RepID=UPI000E2E90FB|nr:right-handed parallel beta-helix repeat-containing protein [Bacillus sp. OE]
MPIKLHRWPNTAQDRNFRNRTNENWDKLEKTHNTIEELSETAIVDSTTAKELAIDADILSKSVQKQLDTIVINNGESDAEVLQARVDENGDAFDTIKERIDQGFLNSKTKIDALNKSAFNVLLFPGVVGNGVHDDTDGIQLAIKTASIMGVNSVFFPPSYTFMIDVQKRVMVPSNMTLSGIKGQSKIKALAATYKNILGSSIEETDNPNYINSMFVTGDINTRQAFTHDKQGYNIHFDGLVIDGNGQLVDQTNNTFNKSVNGSAIRGIWVRGFTIKNCEVFNCLGSGVYTYSCTKQVINDNTVYNNGLFEYNSRNGYSRANGLSRNGISLAGGYQKSIIPEINPYPYSYDAIVSGNIVHDNGDEGIMFAYQKRILITGNIIHHNGDRGIEGDTSYKTSDVSEDVNGDVTISHNQVYDNVYHGITVGSSNNQKIFITDNMIYNAGATGISVDQSSGADVKINDNIIYNIGTLMDGKQYHCIDVQANESTVQNNTINGVSTGNSKPGFAINIARCVNSIVSGNKISNVQSHGVSVDLWNQSVIGAHANSVIVADNIVNKCRGNGIKIGGAMPADDNYNRIRQISITGNNIFNYGEGNGAKIAFGIIFYQDVKSDSVVITGNTIYEDRESKFGANALAFKSTTYGNITNATIVGNNFSDGSFYAAIDGQQYITNLVEQGNNVTGKRTRYGTSAPTSGTSGVGDVVINTSPGNNKPFGWVCVSGGTPGIYVEFGFIKQQRSQQIVFSGDGVSTTKTIPHGLSATPNAYFVQAVSLDAGNAVIKRVVANSTDLIVTFNTAPVSGSNNITLNWRAEI